MGSASAAALPPSWALEFAPASPPSWALQFAPAFLDRLAAPSGKRHRRSRKDAGTFCVAPTCVVLAAASASRPAVRLQRQGRLLRLGLRLFNGDLLRPRRLLSQVEGLRLRLALAAAHHLSIGARPRRRAAPSMARRRGRRLAHRTPAALLVLLLAHQGHRSLHALIGHAGGHTPAHALAECSANSLNTRSRTITNSMCTCHSCEGCEG